MSDHNNKAPTRAIEQWNLVGARMKIMWEEQLVDPPNELTSVLYWPVNKPVNLNLYSSCTTVYTNSEHHCIGYDSDCWDFHTCSNLVWAFNWFTDGIFSILKYAGLDFECPVYGSQVYIFLGKKTNCTFFNNVVWHNLCNYLRRGLIFSSHYRYGK